MIVDFPLVDLPQIQNNAPSPETQSANEGIPNPLDSLWIGPNFPDLVFPIVTILVVKAVRERCEPNDKTSFGSSSTNYCEQTDLPAMWISRLFIH